MEQAEFAQLECVQVQHGTAFTVACITASELLQLRWHKRGCLTSSITDVVTPDQVSQLRALHERGYLS